MIAMINATYMCIDGNYLCLEQSKVKDRFNGSSVLRSMTSRIHSGACFGTFGGKKAPSEFLKIGM